jgi:hypothetical protein
MGRTEAENEILSAMRVRVNPTVHEDGERWRFLTSSGKRELFQRLDRTASVDLVHEVTAQKTASLSLGQLVQLIVDDHRVDATPEEAIDFIKTLLEIGFIRVVCPVDEHTVDWATPLIEFLDRIPDAIAQETARALLRAREILVESGHASVEHKASLVHQLRITIQSVAESLRFSTQELNDQLLFEDATSNCNVRVILNQSTSAALETLQRYIEIVSRLAHPRSTIAELRHFFDNNYQEMEEVPLLKLYEDSQRFRLEKRRLNTSEQASIEPRTNVEQSLAVAVDEARATIHRFMQESWAQSEDATEINLPSAHLLEIVKDIEPIQASTSVTVFCAVAVGDDGQTRIVLKNGCCLPGAGKYFSRFLYILPPAVLEDVRAANCGRANGVLAEIQSDAHFNANLHPPLVGSKIVYPTNESHTAGTIIHTSDLVVRRDAADRNGLAIVNSPTDERVLPLDLGFLSPLLRPPLHQLLSAFAPTGSFELWIPPVHLDDTRSDDANQLQAKNAPKLRHRPRFCFDNCVVLARECWIVPSELFPRSMPNETASEYFVRLHAWRATHGIPNRVYARVAPLPRRDAGNNGVKNEELENEARGVDERSDGIEAIGGVQRDDTTQPRRRSRDLYKPQFIDFYNPLLVELFRRLPGELSHFTVILEEEFPRQDQTPRGGDGQFATELMLQVEVDTQATPCCHNPRYGGQQYR